MENAKIKLIFPHLFIYIFIFAWISQESLKKWVQIFFFLRFSWKFPYKLILIWTIQKSNWFFQVFSSSSSYFESTFLPSSSSKLSKLNRQIVKELFNLYQSKIGKDFLRFSLKCLGKLKKVKKSYLKIKNHTYVYTCSFWAK